MGVLKDILLRLSDHGINVSDARVQTSFGKPACIDLKIEIKNSILLENAKAPHHNYVGDSIIGKNCNLGSGTKIANLRLDKKEINVVHKGKLVNTGRKKMGVIMGDNVATGINSSINSGTIIGSDTKIGPNALISGTYESKSLII